MLLEVKACRTAEVLVLTLLCVFIAKKKWNRNYIKLYSVDMETTIEFGIIDPCTALIENTEVY